MDTLLKSASGPQELVNIDDPKVPYRFRSIFPGQSFFGRRLDKQRYKLLLGLESDVRRMLEEGEYVEYVSWGVEYSFAEAYFMGIWHYLVNRRALLFTNRRILMIQVDSRRKAMDLSYQVQYQAIQKFSFAGLGHMRIVFRDKKKMVVTSVPRRDRKALRELVSTHMRDMKGQAPVAARENLCPYCAKKVVGLPDRCSQCARPFKSGERAGWLSMLFPGLGDWYLGHRTLAAMEIMGGVVAWGFILAGVGATFFAGEAVDFVEVGILIAIVVAMVHGTDAWITRRIGMKGVYPAQKVSDA